ncbi:MAG: hypothetical protein R3D88_06880 [Alphaproteobacteria bacterium]|nr:hypothetical protein [Alphaproteobacteria bacterium]
MSKPQKTEHPSWANARANLHELGFKKRHLLWPIVPAAATVAFLQAVDFKYIPAPDSVVRNNCINNHIPNIQTKSQLSYTVLDQSDGGAIIKIAPQEIQITESSITYCIGKIRTSEKIGGKILTGVFAAMAGLAGIGVGVGYSAFRNRQRKDPAPSA